ncbi:hypothetical protein JCM11641_003559 [Rhodosporidiobolus odoratus]
MPTNKKRAVANAFSSTNNPRQRHSTLSPAELAAPEPSSTSPRSNRLRRRPQQPPVQAVQSPIITEDEEDVLEREAEENHGRLVECDLLVDDSEIEAAKEELFQLRLTLEDGIWVQREPTEEERDNMAEPKKKTRGTYYNKALPESASRQTLQRRTKEREELEKKYSRFINPPCPSAQLALEHHTLSFFFYYDILLRRVFVAIPISRRAGFSEKKNWTDLLDQGNGEAGEEDLMSWEDVLKTTKAQESAAFKAGVRRAAEMLHWIHDFANLVTLTSFQAALQGHLLPGLGVKLKKDKFSLSSATRWLRKLGWQRCKIKKGIHVDGHEREDVIKYRNEVFLPAMLDQMITYEGDDLVPVLPNLGARRRIIPLYHDKSCIHAWEYKTEVWLPGGKTALPKKSRGRIIHTSEFITPEGAGRLFYTDKNGVKHEARTVIYPGALGDAWWDLKQLKVQIERTIIIFDTMYPGCQALFVFDQSSAHSSRGEDALKAFGMRVNDGGKVTIKHDTYFPPENVDSSKRGQVQQLSYLDSDGKLRPKGLKTVLTERGINIADKNGSCKSTCAEGKTDCCLSRILSLHEDFRNEKPALQKQTEKAGHACIFLPKFHCELNPIEM